MRVVVLTKQMTSRVSYHLQILLEGRAKSLTMQLSFPIFLIWRVLWGNRFQKAAIYQRLKENPQEICPNRLAVAVKEKIAIGAMDAFDEASLG